MRGAVPTEMSSTCIQGGVRPLGGYQPNMMMQPSSPNTAWQYHSLIPKQEPLDSGEKTDSGIHTGSDLSSSSPASDRSDNFTIADSPMSSQVMNTPMAPAYYSTPVIRNAQSGFQEQKFQSEQQPPIKQKSEGNECFNFNGSENPLKSLQMSMEKNGLLTGALSPKHSEYSTDENKSDNDIDEYDEQGLRMPKVNSHGKVKQFKCKQCDFVAITKLDFWEHTKSHIKADKRLTCPKCPFVTEYKHHLEYHLRNHVGAKPFKCPQCRYSCVNKSMLNSHMKSHSNVYQYRCANCTYATKYCHSLKLHLRKYSHEPAMVLNPDGTPNPLPIIDVYGTRRGPKVKTVNGVNNKLSERTSPPPTQMLPYPLTQLMLASPPQLQFGGFPLFPLPNPLLLQNLERLARESQGSLPPVSAQDESSSEHNASPVHHTENENGVLDLSKHDTPTTQQNRRKGRAFKFTQVEDNSSEDEEEGTTTMFSNVEVVEHNPEKEKEDPAISTNNNNNEKYRCEYCDITFGDQVLHSIHMGYHGFNNPFTCNGCGEELKDKVEFYIHVVRKPHT